jgi:hypothetical protein
VLGSVMAMPAGALAAGPIAAAIGVFPAEYGAAAITIAACLLALAPREIRSPREPEIRSSEPETEHAMAGS